MIYKTLKIEQHEPTKNRMWTPSVGPGYYE
jgi:hypothetical protein